MAFDQSCMNQHHVDWIWAPRQFAHQDRKPLLDDSAKACMPQSASAHVDKILKGIQSEEKDSVEDLLKASLNCTPWEF